MSAIIPVQQDLVDFDGSPVIGVRLPDGRIGASLRDMCAAMKIDRGDQVQRIKGDETIADSLVSVMIQTRGGPQQADILTAWAIPYWLTGVELSRIKDEKKRAAILLFKRKAADVLYHHFSVRAAPPALPQAAPQQPAPDASALAWADYHRQMAAFFEWKAATDTRIDVLEAQYESVEDRLEGYKPVIDLIPEILERLGPEKLTAEHQEKVQQYVEQLCEASGKHRGTIYTSLHSAFKVPRYQELLESDWPKVENWFNTQIELAKKRKHKS